MDPSVIKEKPGIVLIGDSVLVLNNRVASMERRVNGVIGFCQ